MSENTPKIPKTIWMLWFQGLETAPDLVKKCYASWQRHNPNWDIKFLDETTVGQYVDLEAIVKKNLPGIKKVTLSDILRVNLLAKYGGVWADATCFCCRPLDSWIESHAEAGFFAFCDPGRDRLFDAWFLASSKDCYLIEKLCKRVNSFFSDNVFNYENKARYDTRLEAIVELHRSLTWLSFTFPVTKILKIYPYFWLPYLAAEVIKRDKECRRIWDQAKKIKSREPIAMQLAGLLNPMTEEIKEVARRQFLHKLSWKYDQSKYRPGCVLDWVLHSS